MAFPVVEARATSDGATGTSHTINLPSGITTGDLLIVVFGLDFTSATVTWPLGWTQIAEGTGDGANRGRGFVGYRVADGTEGYTGTGDTISITTSASDESAAVSLRISAHGQSNSVAPAIANSNGGGGDAVDPPNLAPAGGAADYLWIASRTSRNGSDVTVYPTNYTNGTENSNTGAVSAATCERQLNASSEDPGAFSVDIGRPWSAFTIAVSPDAGGGGPVTVEGAITDGLTLGESLARRAALLAGITDGLNVGESPARRASFTTAIGDSATFSDTGTARAAFIAAAADGVTLADTGSGRTTARTAIADGLTISDSLAVAAVLSALVADGVTLAEVLDGQLAGAITAIAQDGLRLGDTPTALAQLVALASDGTTFGNSVLVVLTAIARASDGVTFGDTALGDTLASLITALITDGLAFGDTGTVQASLLATVSDGVQFGETLQAVTALLAAVSDGFTLGDITITIEATGLVNVTFTSKRGGSITFTIKQPGVGFTSKAPGVSFTGES